MPVNLTAPGVYIEEIPSGVRTISGVATSVTAFIGRAVQGPVNDPVLISSFSEYERRFGGLSLDSTMSYTVRDFFLNGGAQAVIVRLYGDPEGDPLVVEADGVARLAIEGSPPDATRTLLLEAASPGQWGNELSAEVDREGVTAEVAERYGVDQAALFNLIVRRGDPDAPVAVEAHRNVTVVESSRRVDRVLASSSPLLRVQVDGLGAPILPDNPPIDQVPVAAAGGADSAAITDTAVFIGNREARTGMYALQDTDIFNLLCIPPDTREGTTSADVYAAAVAYCVEERAMLIVDPPAAWNTPADVTITDPGVTGVSGRNAAVYYPRVLQRDPLRENQIDTFVPCGIVAGQMAATDVRRGVWKAPAGIDAALSGVAGLSVPLNDTENGQLNDTGVNCFRTFPVYGTVVWGARTMRGANQLADEYKYVPVRRLALFIEESLYRGSQWVVFEPNDEPLWAQIRLNFGAFMHNLFRQGAFQGSTPKDAYLVKCDSETTTQDDINRGVVNILVGFAPLKPAEFVIIQLQQLAGQIAS